MTGRSAFGTVRQRPNGSWQARWQDASGHSHSHSAKTKRDASSWLASQDVERRSGAWTDGRHGRITVEAWQARWRSTVVDLRPSTRARDFGYIDRYVLPTFGAVPLADVDYLKVTAWVADLQARELAPATVVKAAQILGKILRAAVRAKMIGADPTADVELPTVEVAEVTLLQVADIHALADAIDERYRGLVYLGCFGGLRIGELLGLRVRQVDPMRRKVRVSEVVVDVSGHLVVNAPKTRAGTRTVPLPRLVLDEIEPHLYGRLPDALVFPAAAGGQTRYSNWRRRSWAPACLSAGLSVTAHDMRHTAVSMWIAQGATPKECAVWAGHRSVSTILDRYGHLFAGLEDRVMDALDDVGARPMPRLRSI